MQSLITETVHDIIGSMKPYIVRPTRFDRALADGISTHTRPVPETIGRGLSCGADEHALLALSALVWIYTEATGSRWRPQAVHTLLVLGVSAAAPHLLKRVFDQTRPDRLTVVGHLHGVGLSGNRKDAFPSGHAVHMGALASAAGGWPEPLRSLTRAGTLVLSAARVLVQAHWLSDVLAGFGLGIVLEQLIRPLNRAGRGGDDG